MTTLAASSVPTRSWPVIVGLWLLLTFYAVFLLTLGSFDLLKPIPVLGLVFNDMLAHLLAGRFDVDPATIWFEAFVHDGRAYAYFGIFCAALRLPLLLIGDLHHTDITKLSMAVAVSLGWLARLGAFATVFAQAPRNSETRTLCAIVLLAATLGGESTEYLKPSLYQEVVAWAMAFASGFVFLLVRLLLVPAAPRTWLLCGMALFAGLALLTRATTGVGLYLAIGLILCVLFVRTVLERYRLFDALFSIELLAPVAILFVFALAVGVVNFERWGNPLTFMDMHLYAWSHTVLTDRIPRLDRYGQFNLGRIPFGLQYYLLPVWMFQDGAGQFIWQHYMLRLTEAVELPPGSLLLGDGAMCLLAGYFFWQTICRRVGRSPDIRLTMAAFAGLAVPILLVLSFIYFAHRYREEFYPFLDTASFLGLALLLRAAPASLRWWKPVLLVVGVIGAITAQATLYADLLTPPGSATDLDMSRGWLGFYRGRLGGEMMIPGYHVMPPGRDP